MTVQLLAFDVGPAFLLEPCQLLAERRALQPVGRRQVRIAAWRGLFGGDRRIRTEDLQLVDARLAADGAADREPQDRGADRREGEPTIVNHRLADVCEDGAPVLAVRHLKVKCRDRAVGVFPSHVARETDAADVQLVPELQLDPAGLLAEDPAVRVAFLAVVEIFDAVRRDVEG